MHVLDIAQAIGLTLAAPADAVQGQIFNDGADRQNYRVRAIAEIVEAAFPGCRTSFGSSNGDNRSYRVDFSKIRRHLPASSAATTRKPGRATSPGCSAASP